MNQYKAKIIDGKGVAAKIHQQLKIAVDNIVATGAPAPLLAIILIGKNDASEIYVRNKMRAAAKIGIDARLVRFSSDITNEQLIAEIGKLNSDEQVSGIIVQLPLPAHINKVDVINMIDPAKDVDGFHPINVGSLYPRYCLYGCAAKFGCFHFNSFG